MLPMSVLSNWGNLTSTESSSLLWANLEDYLVHGPRTRRLTSPLKPKNLTREKTGEKLFCGKFLFYAHWQTRALSPPASMKQLFSKSANGKLFSAAAGLWGSSLWFNLGLFGQGSGMA